MHAEEIPQPPEALLTPEQAEAFKKALAKGQFGPPPPRVIRWPALSPTPRLVLEALAPYNDVGRPLDTNYVPPPAIVTEEEGGTGWPALTGAAPVARPPEQSPEALAAQQEYEKKLLDADMARFRTWASLSTQQKSQLAADVQHPPRAGERYYLCQLATVSGAHPSGCPPLYVNAPSAEVAIVRYRKLIGLREEPPAHAHVLKAAEWSPPVAP
jgi:hypothetical protein